MEPQVQAYLAGRLLTLRELARHNRPDDHSLRETLAHVAGALEALRAAGALTDEEHTDWQQRAFESAQIEPTASSRAAVWTGYNAGNPVSTMQVAAKAGAPAAPPPRPAPVFPMAPARFVRLVPAPDDERDFFGGRLRIIGVELYDTEAAVHWRLAPLPDMALAMPEETRAFERDIAGLPEEEARRLRPRRPGPFLLADRFTIGDDAGTSYTRRGGGAQASDMQASGRIVVVPPPPPEARELRVDALGEVFTIPLAPQQPQA
jgi:hypothetical protein